MKPEAFFSDFCMNIKVRSPDISAQFQAFILLDIIFLSKLKIYKSTFTVCTTNLANGTLIFCNYIPSKDCICHYTVISESLRVHTRV